MTKSTVKAHDVIGHLRQAIDAARRRGIPVMYGPMAYPQEDYASGKLQCRCGINRLMFEQKMFLAGSWGANFHPELKPTEGEIVLLPHKGTAVLETDLPHLVIAGMTANLRWETTGRRATENGYDVTFLSDAIGAENMVAYEASLPRSDPMTESQRRLDRSARCPPARPRTLPPSSRRWRPADSSRESDTLSSGGPRLSC